MPPTLKKLRDHIALSLALLSIPFFIPPTFLEPCMLGSWNLTCCFLIKKEHTLFLFLLSDLFTILELCPSD